MQYFELPALSIPTSRLVQGTLALAHTDLDQAFRYLDEVFSAGCNAFDTARVYASGEAERRLGDWIESRGVRHDVVIITKGCHPRAGLARVSAAALEEDVSRSLEALRVETLDLYLLHRDDPNVPVAEIIDALALQRERGRIRAFGASNWTHQRIEAANEYALHRGTDGFCISSPGFSLARAEQSWPGCVTLTRPEDDSALAWYASHRLPLLAWSPLAAGFLSGRFPLREPGLAGSAPGSPICALDATLKQAEEFYASPHNYQRLERLLELSRRRNVPPAQLALAYVFTQSVPILAVVGCRTLQEFAECAAALNTPIGRQERQGLECQLG